MSMQSESKKAVYSNRTPLKHSPANWWQLHSSYNVLRAEALFHIGFCMQNIILAQRPVTQNFDVFFYLSLHKRLSKEERGHRAHYDVTAVFHRIWIDQSHNPIMHLSHIPQCTTENRNVHISVLNCVLWDTGQVHWDICETVLLWRKIVSEKLVSNAYTGTSFTNRD